MTSPDPLQEIKQNFLSQYPLEDTYCHIGQDRYRLLAIPDAELLLDQLLAQGDDNEEVIDERLPYWAELWPSAIALSEHLLEACTIEPRISVIELGCGMGLCGMIAATLGAEVLLTDYAPQALELAQLNWQLNKLPPPACQVMDWRAPQTDKRADLILASDVAYEERFFQPLIDTFKLLLNPGGTIMLSEPHRELAIEFFDLLEDQDFAYHSIDRQVSTGSCTIPIAVHEIYRV